MRFTLPVPTLIILQKRFSKPSREHVSQAIHAGRGSAARGLALVAEASGETQRAFEVLSDARARCNRLADPYVWLDVYILDAQCELGRRHGHPSTALSINTMRELVVTDGNERFCRALHDPNTCRLWVATATPPRRCCSLLTSTTPCWLLLLKG